MKTKKLWLRTGVWILLLATAVVLCTDFSSDVYDVATPQGSDDPAEADDRMREIKESNRVRQDVDHFWELTGTQVSGADTGEHRKVLYHAPITSPATVAASHGVTFIKDVAGKAELHWIDEDEQEIQLTSAGTILLADGRITNDTYLLGIDNAGTGTVNLIKAGTNDLATLPDSAEMATSAAPVEDEAIANKKYVDDNVGAANWTPTVYAGEASIVFPNGLIMKQGFSASTGPQTIDFVPDFPTACVNLMITLQDPANSSAGSSNESIKTLSAASADVWINTAAQGFFWIAIGH